MTKHKILSIIAGALMAPAMMPLGANAAETDTALVVTYTWGAEEIFFLSDKPTISFGGDKLRITAPDVVAERGMADIDNCTFEIRPTSAVESATESVAFMFTDGQNVTLTGLPANAPCAIYDTKGTCVATLAADATGRMTTSLSSLPKGIYILSANKTNSYKLNVR